MAYREVHGVEIQEIIRRWQAGLSQRRIASGMGLSRQTVRRYIDAAEAAGLTPDGPEPSEEQLAALATLSLSGPRQVEAPSEELLSPWAEQIERWLETDRLQLTRIQELLAGRGCEVSYTTLRRFIRRRGWRHRLPSTVRMDDGPPGEVAEMDFGRLGFIRDPESGRRRAVWALVVVWRYSRHCFVWPTTSQKLDAVIEGLEEAWSFFGGVPRYLVIDNFPAAVAGADALHPRLTRGFLEYARHRGFITDPARVRHPRDKPRVERSIPYVRERLFKGGDFRDVVDLRSAARSRAPPQRVAAPPAGPSVVRPSPPTVPVAHSRRRCQAGPPRPRAAVVAIRAIQLTTWTRRCGRRSCPGSGCSGWVANYDHTRRSGGDPNRDIARPPWLHLAGEDQTPWRSDRCRR